MFYAKSTSTVTSERTKCTHPRCLVVSLQNSTGRCFAYSTVVFGQSAGLSKVCLYAGSDWLKLNCQSEVGERSAAPNDEGLIMTITLPTSTCCTRGYRNAHSRNIPQPRDTADAEVMSPLLEIQSCQMSSLSNLK